MKDDKEKHQNHGHHVMSRISQMYADEIIDFLGISSEEEVFDIGGGDGFFSKLIKQKTNHVTLIDETDWNFKELNSLGIKTIQGNICNYEGIQFDLLFIANVYHDIIRECKEKFEKVLARTARKKIAILDFKPHATSFGPPIWMRIEKNDVIKNMERIGFRLHKEKDLEHHYLLIFDRSGGE